MDTNADMLRSWVKQIIEHDKEVKRAEAAKQREASETNQENRKKHGTET